MLVKKREKIKNKTTRQQTTVNSYLPQGSDNLKLIWKLFFTLNKNFKIVYNMTTNNKNS